MLPMTEQELEDGLALLAKAEAPGAFATDWERVHNWIKRHGKGLLTETRRLRSTLERFETAHHYADDMQEIGDEVWGEPVP